MPPLPPIPSTFSHAVATRVLTVVRDGQATELRIDIGQPLQDVPTVTGLDWRCPVRWDEGGRMHVRSVCGIDGFQSLQLAFDTIRHELAAMAAVDGVSLRFLDCTLDPETLLPKAGEPPGAGGSMPPAG